MLDNKDEEVPYEWKAMLKTGDLMRLKDGRIATIHNILYQAPESVRVSSEPNGPLYWIPMSELCWTEKDTIYA